ncbi:Asp-tRNA(Asn)/Glu-tRNA(Gln) amidotransferase subunit GatC [Thermosipho atlanticus]|uniref:Aspartyl/glutamyl-tRNA(Asn/Gln) amidotransferase subunit C n=1 Tax=Thermosipho atlanticus DSM 15807 TaxID=1123380 RepID=A0A1M5RVB2_9BACT|nr:Asp-tRNA(Asn)/Glu-tRNA(Gln) amidotransferase subunit GatC [Thermosipho atlanticus]SHH30109.1 aspartyl/glutamyl-tRNA(Asn/Gln) amidotransferase subunit C [Thermosipho atlanticus DSM 15807]
MKIDEKLVDEVAMLARLKISDKKTFIKEMQKIVDYFQILEEVDTSELEPMYTPIENATKLRDNKVRNFEDVESIRKNFPNRDRNYLKIPGIHK